MHDLFSLITAGQMPDLAPGFDKLAHRLIVRPLIETEVVNFSV